jgi:hypothetical protein
VDQGKGIVSFAETYVTSSSASRSAAISVTGIDQCISIHTASTGAQDFDASIWQATGASLE